MRGGTMKEIIVTILGMILLAGCISTHEKMDDLHRGMSRQEVLLKMGEPDSSRMDENIEILTYSLSVADESGQQVKKDYWVELRDERVFDYGRGWRLVAE
jgi:hypothetical protein